MPAFSFAFWIAGYVNTESCNGSSGQETESSIRPYFITMVTKTATIGVVAKTLLRD